MLQFASDERCVTHGIGLPVWRIGKLVEQRVGYRLLGNESQHLVVRGIGVNRSAFHINEGDANGRALKERPEALFTLLHRSLRPFALGNIEGDAHHSNHMALRIAIRILGGKISTGNARGGARVFVGMRLLRFDHPAVFFRHLPRGFFREKIVIIFADHLWHRTPNQPRARGIDHDVAQLQVFHEDGFTGAFNDGMQKIMVLAQRLGAALLLSLRQQQPRIRDAQRKQHGNGRHLKLHPGDLSGHQQDQKGKEQREHLHHHQARERRTPVGSVNRMPAIAPGSSGDQRYQPGEAPHQVKPLAGQRRYGQTQCKIYVGQKGHQPEVSEAPVEGAQRLRAREPCSGEKPYRGQPVHGERQPPGAQRPSIHGEFGKIDVHQHNNNGYLRKVEDALPVHPFGFRFGIEKQAHHQRSDPCVVKHIDGPHTLRRKVQDAAVITAQGLPDAPQQEGRGHQAPKQPGKCPGAARGLKGSDKGQDSKPKLNQVREYGTGHTIAEKGNDRRVRTQEDDR